MTKKENSIKTRMAQGEALFLEGRVEEAEQYFLVMLEETPSDAEILNNLGAIYHAKGKVDIAETYFLKAIEMDGTNTDARLNIVNLLQQESRWKDVITHIHKLIKGNSDNYHLYNQLGIAYLEIGEKEKACDALKKSLQINHDQKEIDSVLATLENQSHPDTKTDSACSIPANKKSCNGGLNILIRGGGFVNKGAETMVRTVQYQLSSRLPMANFFMEVPKGMQEFIGSKGLLPIIPGSKSRYKNIDGLIDISGFALGDSWGVNNSQFYQYHNSIFEAFEKPVVFLPQAWGPFTNKLIRQLSAAAINLSDYAFARDNRSFQYMNELEGVDRKKIGLAPDIAYQFQGASKAQAMSVLKRINFIPGEKNVIGIMPNMQVYVRTEGKGAENKYIKLLIDIISYFINKPDFSIVLIPHQVNPVENPDAPDDRFLCDLIKTSLNNLPDIFILRDYLSAEIIKAVIGEMDFIIGSRYHGIIAALSQMIPVVVLGWSHKYFELLRDVGIEQYIVDYKNLNKNDLLALVENAWINRKKIKDTLKHNVPEQVYKSAVALDHTASIFADRYSL
jgi:polysaccharide pyruvyl transferase WcaK-like protein